MAYNILILSTQLSAVGQAIQSHFQADLIHSAAQVETALLQKHYRALVVEAFDFHTGAIPLCEALAEISDFQALPIVLVASKASIKDKLRALDLGCDDVLEASLPVATVCMRITQSVFHQIAKEQLGQRLIEVAEALPVSLGAQTSSTVISGFLKRVTDCDNLDQLGQLLFSATAPFGLSCSLQMRCEVGVKNMEAHGMAKDLESQLLWHMKDRGRYVDFGERSIVNLDHVSLLLRAMPTSEPAKCAAIKELALYLAQVVNQHVVTLEQQLKLLDE